ncbi:MAG: LysM peptidoglycan-binding domain-containing protein, partial [Methylocystis sp.]|nr:LysM peptidoglycan-binding domain-containing protein [Methylocystis sp.]
MAVKRRVFLSRAALRLVFAAGIAAWVAGCSDATRLSDPFADPFGGSPRGVDRAPTGAILEPRSVQSRAIQSSPLPPATDASSANAPPPRSMSAGQSALRAGRAGSYAHWSAEGGTPIVAAQGETAEMIAMRYGVPAEALLRVNGLTSAAQVRPGARLVIPVYRA